MSLGPAPSMEPELRGFLQAIASEVERFAVPFGDVPRMRVASAAARMPWQRGGPAIAASAVEGLGMPVTLYHPKGLAATPVLVYLHGGGWSLLSAATHDRLLREYVEASGWAVLAPDYPLSPEARFPLALQHCIALVDRLPSVSAQLGLDPGCLVLGGDSSGANLAMAMTIEGTVRPAGLLLNYAVLDSAMDRASYGRYGDPPHILNHHRMSFFWSNYCGTPEHRASALASPTLATDAQLAALPACFMVIAGQDVLVDENEAMAARLTALGVELQVVRYPMATHGFLEAVAVSPSAKAAVAETAGWLRAVRRGVLDGAGRP